ncbi:MAG TPA: hypothetical protein PLY10_08230 [Bacillota bacterium]|nr:hypothetical protein [Bacillota bacterium]
MKRVGVILLFAALLCFSIQASPTVSAALGEQVVSSELERSSAQTSPGGQPTSSGIAKQLLAPGWEHPHIAQSVPVVVYTVSLSELDSSMASRLEFGFETANGVQDGVWDVTFDHAVVRLLREASDALHSKVSGSVEEQRSAVGYQSWLVTLEERPVEVLIQQTTVLPSAESQERDSEFRLRLTPRHVDAVSNVVLTELELDLLTPSGGVGRAKSSVLVSTEPQPMAVVKRAVAATNESEDLYFAMYLSADVVSLAQLPRDVALLPIGSIGGFQQLFEERRFESVQPAPQWRISLAGGHDLRFGVVCAFPLSSKLSVRGNLEMSEKGLGGYADVSVEVHDRLGIAVQIDKRGSGGSPIVRLGLVDETVLGDRLHLRATYLPIQIDLSKADITASSCVTLEAVLKQTNWDLWYQRCWYNGGLDNEIGMTLATGSHTGVDFSWLRDRDGSTWFRIGVVFRIL